MQCWDDKANQEEAYLARELRVRDVDTPRKSASLGVGAEGGGSEG